MRSTLVSMHLLPRWAAVGLVGVVVAACGASGSGVSSAAPSVGPTAPSASVQASSSAAVSAQPSSAVASSGPATAQFTLTGSAGLTGPVSTKEVDCGRPTLASGPEIFFLGQAGTTGPQVVIFVSAGHVEVRVATGAAASLRLRSFVGTGVTGFDAAKGAQLDSPLTETTAAGAAVGNLGALTAIAGTVDCGDQQAGTTNVVITGSTPYGPLSGGLTDVKVTCTETASGTFVGINGLGTAGTTPVLIFVTAGTSSLQVAVEIGTTGSFYTAKGAGLTTMVPGGASVSGDVTESVKAGTTPGTLHVTGDATCGTTVHP